MCHMKKINAKRSSDDIPGKICGRCGPLSGCLGSNGQRPVGGPLSIFVLSTGQEVIDLSLRSMKIGEVLTSFVCMETESVPQCQ